MSFGIFEAATAEDLNGTHRKKLAGDRLAQAAAEVDHKLGPMLAKSTSVNDYHDRVRLAEKDFRNIVGKYLEGDSGFIAVAKKLEPHYTKRRSRTASRRVANVEWFESWTPDGSGKAYTTVSDGNAPLSGPGAEVHQSEHLGPGWHWNVFSPEDPYGESGVEATPENAMAAAERLLGGGVTASRRVANIEWFEDWTPDGSGKAYTTISDGNAPLSGPGANVYQSEHLGPGWHWDVFSPENPYGESGVEATPENAMAAAERLLRGGVTASRRVANNDLEDLKEFVHSLGAKTRKRRGRDGFTFPAASGANGAVSVRPNGEIVVETLFGGGAGGMQSVYSPNEIDLVKDWIEKTVGGSYRLSRRRTAAIEWFEVNDPILGTGWSTVDPNQNPPKGPIGQIVHQNSGEIVWYIEDAYTGETFADGVASSDEEAMAQVESNLRGASRKLRPSRLSRRKKANGYNPEQAADILSRENPGISFEQAYDTVSRAMDSAGMSHLSESELVLFLREMKRISSRRKQASDMYQDFLEYAQSAGHDLEKIEQLTSSPDPMDHDHWEVIDFEESMYDYLGADSADDDPRIYDLLDMMGHHGVEIRANRRKQANPWKSPDDALGSGYFPGWQTDHNEDGWWQINSPDGSDALVGEEDGSYTMRLDAETPEEAWAERMNFDEALQESEALHYRKNGGRRRRANAVGQVVDLSGLDQLPIGSVVKTLADDGAASYELEKTGDNQWLWARAGMTVDNNYIGKATVEFIP